MVTGYVRQMTVLYGNHFMGNGLGGLIIGLLDEWSSYRGGRISRFDCSTNLKLHNISGTPKMVKKVIKSLDLSMVSGPDCITVVVLRTVNLNFLTC